MSNYFTVTATRGEWYSLERVLALANIAPDGVLGVLQHFADGERQRVHYPGNDDVHLIDIEPGDMFEAIWSGT